MFLERVAMCATDQGALYHAMTVTSAILVYLSSSLFPDDINDSGLSIEMEVEVVVTMVMVVIVEVFELYIIVSNKKDMAKLTHGTRDVLTMPDR